MNERQESMRHSLEKLDKDILMDGFCLLYDEFREDARAIQDAVPAVTAEPDIPNFVSLVLYLKSRYSFEELNDFVVEGGRVFFKRGGRRIELSREEEDVVSPPTRKDGKDEDSEGGRFGRLELN